MFVITFFKKSIMNWSIQLYHNKALNILLLYCFQYKADKKDPSTDSHGDWWQGIFTYLDMHLSLNSSSILLKC